MACVSASPMCVHVLPASVGLVDAVALHDVAAQLHLAHADVDDVGIRLGDRDSADRRAADLSVGDRLPRDAAVSGLPETAADRAEVVLVRTTRTSGGGDRSPAAIGSDVSPLQRGKDAVVIGAGRAGRLRGRGGPRLRESGRVRGARDQDNRKRQLWEKTEALCAASLCIARLPDIEPVQVRFRRSVPAWPELHRRPRQLRRPLQEQLDLGRRVVVAAREPDEARDAQLLQHRGEERVVARGVQAELRGAVAARTPRRTRSPRG